MGTGPYHSDQTFQPPNPDSERRLLASALIALLAVRSSVPGQLLSVVVVEENDESAELLLQQLGKLREIRSLVRVRGLEELPKQESWDVLFLNPGGSEGAALQSIGRARELAPGAAVVVLTEVDDPDRALEVLRQGAQDYLERADISPPKLLKCILFAVERKQIRDELAAMARTDALTRLLNRRAFEERLLRAISRAKRSERHVGLLYVDLDGFKAINDVHGHEVGDKVLQTLASRFTSCVRNVDSLARIGGDEFAVILDALRDVDEAVLVARRFIQAVSRPIPVPGMDDLQIGASIGVALFPQHAGSAEQLVRAADRAMYAAKHDGGSVIRVSLEVSQAPASGPAVSEPPGRPSLIDA